MIGIFIKNRKKTLTLLCSKYGKYIYININFKAYNSHHLLNKNDLTDHSAIIIMSNHIYRSARVPFSIN